MIYGKCAKISNTFLFLFASKMFIRARIHKMIVRIANREDPDQTADLGLHCSSRPFWQTTSVQNFRTFTVCAFNKLSVIESIVTLFFCCFFFFSFSI